MLPDLRSHARIQSDKQKLDALQATHPECHCPEQTTHYDNIIACINAADCLALQPLFEAPDSPDLPLNAWRQLAEYARAMLEQDCTESDRNNAAIQSAFWHLSVDRNSRPLDFPAADGGPGDAWIQFARLGEGAGVEEAQRVMTSYVATHRLMRMRLEDQAKAVPRALVALGRVDLGSIDSHAVEGMELMIRDKVRSGDAVRNAVEEGGGEAGQGVKQDRGAED